MNYTDKQLEDLINNVYAGIITPKNLPLDLYNVTLDRLTAAIVKGFGTDFAEDSADALLFDYYKHNIAIFSGAKTFQQVKDMTNLVMTSNGVKRDFSEFKKIIKGDQFHDGLFKTYNDTYLKTEFNTAFATAQMGREWNEFASEAEIFPYLKYITVHDDRVRHNHRPFDGVIRPVGDSFWDTHTPPNGFNCRCHVVQLEEGEETTDAQIKNMPDVDSPLFAFNPGKSGRIFDESIHPYTKNIEERYKVDAAKNWGLPTPPKPTKKIKTPTIAAPVPAEAVTMKDRINALTDQKSAKNLIIEMFSENQNMIVEKVSLGRDLPMSELKAKLTQLNVLQNEYEIYRGAEKTIENVSFNGSKTYYGVVKVRYSRFTGSYRYNKVDLGQNNGLAEITDFKTTKFGRKSRVDIGNEVKGTLTHEFAHFIALAETADLSALYNLDERVRPFFGELREIRSEYNVLKRKLYNDMSEASMQLSGEAKDKAYKMLEKIHGEYLGDYANTNIDEFFAEAFKEYKLSSNPSTTALKVGKLIDKYFKKK